MNRAQFLFLVFVVAGVVLIVSCSSSAASVPPTAANVTATIILPTAPIPPSATASSSTSTPTTAAAANPTSKPAASNSSGSNQKINIDDLVPPAPGRDLVLQYCVNCHNIAPIALAHKTQDEWLAWRKDHSGRLAVSQGEWDTILNYLTANLPADRKPPQLPSQLLNDWTSY